MATDSQANKANVVDIVSNVITDNIDTWTSAVKTQSTSGRGSRKKLDLYGIKKLRELILELAVRGKLVPQDPTDEPASVLLKRISEEKDQLVKDKKIKKPKKLPVLSIKDTPFDLPTGWEWSQLGFLTNYGVCDKAEPSDALQDTWVLELEDVEKITSKLLKRVHFSERAFKSSKNIFKKHDVIYGKLRPYLDKVLVADSDGVCTTEMIPVRTYKNLAPTFLRLVMKSPYFISYANESTHGMNLPRMGTDKARAALFPLPPEKEQLRIVAKVDELMLLCDQLEQETESSIDAHKTLVETLLTTLTNSPDSTSMAENWARISEHFDTLFTTEHSIDQLKQTVLQLAVMGKLVPQDPADEPASVLLKRITAEKAQLVADKKIKKQKALPPITDEEKLFGLPDGWEWVRFGDIWGDSFYGPRFGKNEYVDAGGYPTIRTTDMTVDGEILLNNPPSVSVPPEKLNLYALRAGDLLITRSGSIGTMAIFNLNCKAIPSAYLIRVRFTDSSIPEYILKLLMSPLGQNYLGLNTTSVGVPNVNATKMATFPLPIPPLKEQKLILKQLTELTKVCEQLKVRFQQAQKTQLHLADAIVEQAI